MDRNAKFLEEWRNIRVVEQRAGNEVRPSKVEGGDSYKTVAEAG